MHDAREVAVVFAGGGTGGHLYPALAIADALTELRPDVRPHFVGAERGVEARVLPDRGVPYTLLPVRGLRRGRILSNVGVLADLVGAVLRVRTLFRRLRPELVVVTGGYAGAPAGLVAGLQGIPLALWEGNSYPGVTVRRLARWASQIHVGFPEAIPYLPARTRARAVVSGTPIRPPREGDRAEARRSFGLDPAATVVLATGGSQGSTALNDRWLAAVEGVARGRLVRPSGLQLLWATGPANYDGVAARLADLGDPAWVRAVPYLDRMLDALLSADLAVGRAGASTTSEFLAWGIPSILVPLPTSAEGHQALNARALDEAGVALHLPQESLTGETLWQAVTGLAADEERRARMKASGLERSRPGSSREIAGAVAALLPPEGGA